MVIWLIRSVLHLLANAVGLLVAAAALPDFSLDTTALVGVTIVFTAVEIVAGPLLISFSVKNMQALTGAVSLVTTFFGLLIADFVSDGLNISGIGTWLMASLIVWIAALLAGVILPLFLFKKTLEAHRKR